MGKDVQFTIWSCLCWLLILLLEISSWATAQQGTFCPYAKYVPNGAHTACLPANRSCKIVSSGVDQASQRKILQMINDIRSTTALGKQAGAGGVSLPPASDMRQLVWNNELAAIAQAHTKQCGLNFDCFDCRRTEDYPVGQDIYFLYYSYPPKKANWQLVINQWAQGAKQLSSVIAGRYKISAFTQMIWALSRDIGCGFTRFQVVERNRRYVDFFACNFGPAGNYEDLNIYEPGQSCTDCSFASTCCGPTCQTVDYPGLCKIYGQ